MIPSCHASSFGSLGICVSWAYEWEYQYLELWSLFQFAFFPFQCTDHYKILHMPQELSDNLE